MDKSQNVWKEHLVMIGETCFHEAHRKALDELSTNNEFTQVEWNEANSIAMLEAVATMIVENNTAHQQN